ncbi:MAG: FAD-dependent oxidoreductase, partial [Deltaproteobacteria bacterium]|nr:FAD-dependent oxidoreductase [Deltaproteobacteria bacterium]
MKKQERDSISLTINNERISVAAGTTIREAAAVIGVNIPGFCHLPGRKDTSEPCLICMVEVNGEMAEACRTQVAADMVVRTTTPAIDKHRRQRLEYLLSFHYGDCKAPCNLTCPGGINVQGYVNYIAKGEYGAALALIREQNPLPGIVCRVCPRFCESRCRRVLIDEPVAINHLKRFVVEYGRQSAPPLQPGPATGYRAAVIGGGPAGLSCASYLRQFGHEVTIFEARERLGGMPRYAIPSFKLPDVEIDRELETIGGLGFQVRTGKRWGRDFSLQDLREQGFDAIFAAIGIAGQKKNDLPGAEYTQDALDFLQDLRAGKRGAAGTRTLVIGGSQLAVETARCAMRDGAEEVTVVYQRAKVEMNAHQRDIDEAEREGVQFFMMAQPL